jgi:hypothetical protein
VRTPINQLAKRLENYLRNEAEFSDLGESL